MAEVGGGEGSERVSQAQPCFMAKKGLQLIKDVPKPYMGPKFGGGGVRGSLAKCQSLFSFFKPSLSSKLISVQLDYLILILPSASADASAAKYSEMSAI